ncbi:MAG: hypothetical protein ACLFRM_04165 [Guyparkeria sp.]|uniref:hypothetical protein n=1 Tax=Guyparkeria sp. TaxID=2035736 RepID=UPI003978E792
MNIMKQFVLGRRLVGGWALEQGATLDDAAAIRLAESLAERDWQAPRAADDLDLSLLSFLVLETAHRYYVQADKALKSCQSEEGRTLFPAVMLPERLADLAATLRFYDAAPKLAPSLPTNGLASLQSLTNTLFAVIAAQFPEHMAKVHAQAMRAEVAEVIRGDFPRSAAHVPVYSPTHLEFMGAVDKTRCIFAPSGKYWGARDFDESRGLEAGVRRFGEDLFRFMTVARKEKFKGLAFRMPASYSRSIERLAETTATLLEGLNRIDPAGSHCLERVDDRPGWKFEWAGETMFLTAFGVCYPADHPRNPYGFDYTYFFFQPDFVLRNHPGLIDGKEEISRQRILASFRKDGMDYDNAGKEAEHARYIRPMAPDGPAVAWWDYLPARQMAEEALPAAV